MNSDATEAPHPAVEIEVLRLNQVEAKVRLKKSAIYDLMRNGDFPLARKIGSTSGWFKHEIDAWLLSRPVMRVAA